MEYKERWFFNKYVSGSRYVVGLAMFDETPQEIFLSDLVEDEQERTRGLLRIVKRAINFSG